MRIEIAELWSMQISAATLYNIERTDNPEGGNGALYIQVAKGLVEDLLQFLRSEHPGNRETVEVNVGNFMNPTQPQETLSFASKSQGRMRITNQNRHREKSTRPSAWSPEEGFPSLASGQSTEDAHAVLEKIGGLRIFLVRGEDGNLWAGYTTGEASEAETKQPFASINWGTSSPGGYWRYEEDK